MVNTVLYLPVFENKIKDINGLGCPSTYIPGGGTRNSTVNENTSNSINNADYIPNLFNGQQFTQKDQGY